MTVGSLPLVEGVHGPAHAGEHGLVRRQDMAPLVAPNRFHAQRDAAE